MTPEKNNYSEKCTCDQDHENQHIAHHHGGKCPTEKWIDNLLENLQKELGIEENHES